MGEVINNCVSYINGVLILSSVSLIYLVNADEGHEKMIGKVKKYYEEHIAALLEELKPKISNDPKLNEYLLEISVRADNIKNEVPPLHSQYPGHFITHHQALMMLLGLAIGCCSLFYISIFLGLYNHHFTQVLFYFIAFFWVLIIGLFVLYVFKANGQRYRFAKFERFCVKKESLIKMYYDGYR